MIYATEILYKAGNLITGSRKETHGDFTENHKNIAKLYSNFINNHQICIPKLMH